MIVANNQDFAEWRARMVHAVRAFAYAIDAYRPAAEAVKLDQVIRALEHEGRTRGFLPIDGA